MLYVMCASWFTAGATFALFCGAIAERWGRKVKLRRDKGNDGWMRWRRAATVGELADASQRYPRETRVHIDDRVAYYGIDGFNRLKQPSGELIEPAPKTCVRPAR